MDADGLLYEQVFNTVPVGLFLINQDQHIYAWNQWMVLHTHITAPEAIGKSIKELFADHVSPRFDWALELVLSNHHPQILSSTLNQFVIPIPVVKQIYPGIEMMQQTVQILPISCGKKTMALVIIQDATDKTHMKNTLISMAAKFEHSSLIDALTGLYNRRFLWRFLDNELQNAQQESYNVICCLYDLDHFKKINDEFGHSSGDEVLISFGKLAQSVMRASDYFIRYGGEEFIAIFTHITIKSAIKLANRVRKNLEVTLSHGSVNKLITCSGGLAYWQPSDPLLSAEKLVDQADLALYEAKKAGRNCIIVANQDKTN